MDHRSNSKNLCDLGLKKDVLDTTQKAWSIKEQIGLHQYEQFLFFKRHSSENENRLGEHRCKSIYLIWLTSTILKELSKLSKKTTQINMILTHFTKKI